MTTAERKQQTALLYAEDKGILDWKVKGNRMIFYTNYPECGEEPKRTFKVTIRLDTLKEERQLLTKWDKRGNSNWRK